VILTPRCLAGVFSLRGDIVPAIDLGVLLGVGATDAGDDSRIVVVDRDGTTIGCVVDRLRDLRMLDAALEPPPSNLAPGVAQLLLGIAATPTGTVRVLDAAAIVNAEELRALSRSDARDPQEGRPA
jgi:purine-binding chemotaxis protein CheW